MCIFVIHFPTGKFKVVFFVLVIQKKMFLHIVRLLVEVSYRNVLKNIGGKFQSILKSKFSLWLHVLKSVMEFKIWLHIQMQSICCIHTDGECKIPEYTNIRDGISRESSRWTKNYVTHFYYFIIFQYYSTNSLDGDFLSNFTACSD